MWRVGFTLQYDMGQRIKKGFSKSSIINPPCNSPQDIQCQDTRDIERKRRSKQWGRQSKSGFQNTNLDSHGVSSKYLDKCPAVQGLTMHDIRGEVGITILESGESPGYAS